MSQFSTQVASLRCGLRVQIVSRSQRLRVNCAASGDQNDAERPSSSKGKSFRSERRRRGRPAHLRSPDDSPLRDGNRDRLMGLLTERAAKTLAYYLIETNHNVHHWVNRFITDNPIPRDGNWDDVSGDTFLRTLLAMPIEEAMPLGRDPVFHNTSTSDVDPRSIAQRIMEIRGQLATEFIQDLQQVAEDNKLLQLETLQASLLSTEDAIADGSAAARQAATSIGSSSSSSSPSGASSPGGRGGRGVDDDDDDPTRGKARKAKKSVLPPAPTPSNWRMRLEVEAQVYGDFDGAMESSQQQPNGNSGIPDSVMTGIISPTFKPQQAAPQQAASQQPVTPQPAAEAASPPPLHPEVAEVLTLMRSSPSALMPDVAQMLSSLAAMSNGQLHPDIIDALKATVAAGAQLHPEMAELLTLDNRGMAAPAAASSSSGSSGVSKAVAASPPPLGQLGKSSVQPASTTAAAAAASLPQAVESVQVLPQQEQQQEEENSITALQNDICLHSDDE